MSPLALQVFIDEAGNPAIAEDVVNRIERMPPDPSLADYVRKLQLVAASTTRYWDLACALNLLARKLRPTRYLEIGVRRGKSMAQVAGQCPECEIVGIDLWIQPYGGVDNPGPDYVRTQMQAMGHRATLSFVSGDSRVELPKLVATYPEMRFDIITVDGDHSDEGAWFDLCTVAPLLVNGGYLLFDDLTHPAHTLGPVWNRFQREYSKQFEFTENLRDHSGTGVARRRG